MEKFDPYQNYLQTKDEIGYVPRKTATQKDYDRIGFKSGLEVHQQLKTQKKLFCHCPAGVFHDHDDYDAEIIRHMRPTLSELGEYDGTALMEFKTRKEIIYRINNRSACTYEIDDTPPFLIDREALDIAIEISLLSKLNVVGEVHITRKQYLDGSIPTGFQRTAIIGVEGEIQLRNKKLRLIQLSIEEDSCREISDIAHTRVYKTDRLGMPLIETVTYPDCVNPDELREAGEYIRFLNRSTGKVRTGPGAGREDVNVSCRGGSRVEIKGVSHNKWIPELSHNEAFRQFALLNIREKLKAVIKNTDKWKIKSVEIFPKDEGLSHELTNKFGELNYKVYAVNLPCFSGTLSHFTQPGKSFASEIEDRLKVIACIERPNMTHSENWLDQWSKEDQEFIQKKLKAKKDDAQIIFWSPEDDVKTALETIEERCKMAFEGVPNETRKSFANGTTIFERVLPGADRMYPDTDSAPIPLDENRVEELRKNLPVDIYKRIEQMQKWHIPEDTFTYILRNNLVPIIEDVANLGVPAKFVGTFLGHTLKNVEGTLNSDAKFNYQRVVELFDFITKNKLDIHLSKRMIPVVFEHPTMDFESVLTSISFKRRKKAELLAPVDYLFEKFKETNKNHNLEKALNWIMGQLHKQASGNMKLNDLRKEIEKQLN